MAIQPVHVDINQEIQDWRIAVYGEEVREANVEALTKLQDQMNGAVDYVAEKGEAVDQATKDVQVARLEAQGAVDHANEISSLYKKYADDKLAATEQERKKAESARQGSESAKTLSESWAHGNTGSRQGENTDNAQYWSQQSKTDADRAKDEADRASQYAQITAPGFYLDLESSTLYIKGGAGVSFIIDENTQLYWKIIT